MDKLEELAQKKELCCSGGGEEKIQIQHNMNKLTARERINHVLDDQSFVEFGALIGGNGKGIITGYGTINGRLVYLYSEDYTVDGGLISIESSTKICNVMEMALKMGAPLIQIIDSAGAKINEGLQILSAYGRIIAMNSKLSGVVPQITVIAGPCTGIAAISASMGDIAIIAENSGEIYINSPETIEEVQNKHIKAAMYSKAEISSKNGSIHKVVKDDKEALNLVRLIIDYLPSNNLELPISELGNSDTINNKFLNEVINKDFYEIKEVISSIADKESILELGEHISNVVTTAFVKINGITVGMIASNKGADEGRLNIKACEKVAKFVKLCNSFNISLVTLVDSKGFIANVEEEINGLAAAASKLLYSLAEASVPKVALIIGDAYGAGFITMASKETSFDITYAWPTAKISLADPVNVVKVLYKEEITASDNPAKKKEEMLNSYIETNMNIYRAAELGYIDDIIIPSETTLKLYTALDMLQSKRVIKYPKKHGSTLI